MDCATLIHGDPKGRPEPGCPTICINCGELLKFDRAGGDFVRTEGKYVLDENGEPRVETDLMTWARWIEDKMRNGGKHVADVMICGARVSTVFLGIDHSWGKGPPILWETMVFGGRCDEEMDRCGGSREQAMAMHERMAALVEEAEIKFYSVITRKPEGPPYYRTRRFRLKVERRRRKEESLTSAATI